MRRNMSNLVGGCRVEPRDGATQGELTQRLLSYYACLKWCGWSDVNLSIVPPNTTKLMKEKETEHNDVATMFVWVPFSIRKCMYPALTNICTLNYKRLRLLQSAGGMFIFNYSYRNVYDKVR